FAGNMTIHRCPSIPALAIGCALLATACAQTRYQVVVPARSPAIKKVELVFEQAKNSTEQMTFSIKHPSDYRPVFSDPGRTLRVRYGDDPVTFSYPGTGTGPDRVAIVPPRDLPDHDKRRALYKVELNLNDSFDPRTCQAIEREPYIVGVEGAAPRRV